MKTYYVYWSIDNINYLPVLTETNAKALLAKGWLSHQFENRIYVRNFKFFDGKLEKIEGLK